MNDKDQCTATKNGNRCGFTTGHAGHHGSLGTGRRVIRWQDAKVAK
jgi:hypothetical protein